MAFNNYAETTRTSHDFQGKLEQTVSVSYRFLKMRYRKIVTCPRLEILGGQNQGKVSGGVGQGLDRKG